MGNVVRCMVTVVRCMGTIVRCMGTTVRCMGTIVRCMGTTVRCMGTNVSALGLNHYNYCVCKCAVTGDWVHRGNGRKEASHNVANIFEYMTHIYTDI